MTTLYYFETFFRSMWGHLLELVDCETWRELQCNITIQFFFKFGKIWVINGKGSLIVRDREWQNYLENKDVKGCGYTMPYNNLFLRELCELLSVALILLW